MELISFGSDSFRRFCDTQLQISRPSYNRAMLRRFRSSAGVRQADVRSYKPIFAFDATVRALLYTAHSFAESFKLIVPYALAGSTTATKAICSTPSLMMSSSLLPRLSQTHLVQLPTVSSCIQLCSQPFTAVLAYKGLRPQCCWLVGCHLLAPQVKIVWRANAAGELGNLEGLPSSEGYHGVALTLIDSLSTLAVLGERSEFEKGVRWLQEHVSISSCHAACCLLLPAWSRNPKTASRVVAVLLKVTLKVTGKTAGWAQALPFAGAGQRACMATQALSS